MSFQNYLDTIKAKTVAATPLAQKAPV